MLKKQRDNPTYWHNGDRKTINAICDLNLEPELASAMRYCPLCEARRGSPCTPVAGRYKLDGDVHLERASAFLGAVIDWLGGNSRQGDMPQHIADRIFLVGDLPKWVEMKVAKVKQRQRRFEEKKVRTNK